MKKFYICTMLDCPSRNVDSQRIYNYLMSNRWKFTPDVTHADLVVITTCGVSKITEAASLNTIKTLFEKKNDRAKIVLSGCLPKINNEAIEKIGEFVYLSPADLNQLDDMLQLPIKFDTIPEGNVIYDIPSLLFKNTGTPNSGEEQNDTLSQTRSSALISLKRTGAKVFNRLQRIIAHFRFQTKYQGNLKKYFYHIKVAEGCLGACTYCAIKFSIGKLKSKPLPDIIQEFERGLAKGHRLFSIVGEDVGNYGVDIGSNIVELLTKLFSYPGDFKIGIQAINIGCFIKHYDKLLPLFRENADRLVRLMLPIQSGSETILRSMKRYANIDRIKFVLNDFHAKLPDLRLNTHIIVGFPGENDEEYRKIKAFLEELTFMEVSFYAYSDRRGTEAYAMPGKVPEHIIRKRLKELQAIKFIKRKMTFDEYKYMEQERLLVKKVYSS